MKFEDCFPHSFKALRQEFGIPEPSSLSWVAQTRSDDSDLCHEMLSTFGFTEAQVHRAAERYHLGKSRSGKTIYWMIDELGFLWDGRIGNSWVTTMLKSRYPAAAPHLQVKHCLFGLHQLSECGSLYNTQAGPLMVPAYHSVRATGGAVASSPKGRPWRGDASLVPFLRAEEMNTLKPVGLVESERTAVLLSELCPELLWLAYSYASNCTIDQFAPLQGRKIILYPRTDLTMETYLSFLELADQVRRTYNLDISVSSLLEDHATDDQKQRHIDLLDFIFEHPE